jgi:CRP/FNR family transcriptional regulator
MFPDKIRNQLSFLGEELLGDIESESKLMDVPSGTELLHEGQYVKVIPLVLDGLIRVYITDQEKEMLLYYIQPKESCIMSFSAGLGNSPSRINAVCIEDSKILAIPVDKMNIWAERYPSLIHLLYGQFNLRYLDLIETISQVIFNKLDERLMVHLNNLSNLQQNKLLDVRHHQLANELGTAREVVTRILKKLEEDGKIIQHSQGIEIL